MRISMTLWALLGVAALKGETGADAWLRYDTLGARRVTAGIVVTLGDSPILHTARQELIRGVRGMAGRTLRIEASLPAEEAIVLGTLSSLRAVGLALPGELAEDAFWLKTVN